MKDNEEIKYFEDIDKTPNSLILISVINFVLGSLSFFYFSFFTLLIIFGLFGSGDPPADKLAGVIGSQCLGFPGLLGSILFISSGIGVVRLKGWGYYIQMATAILAILSLIGIPYGVPILLTLLKPETKKLFSKSDSKERKSLPGYYD